MSLASKISTGLVALPHLLFVLENRKIPTLNHVVLLSLCLIVIFRYTKTFEVCGNQRSTNNRYVATVLLPPLVTLAVVTSAILYLASKESSSSQVDTLGSSLGVVRQYRLDEVIDRLRTFVTIRQEERNLE